MSRGSMTWTLLIALLAVSTLSLALSLYTMEVHDSSGGTNNGTLVEVTGTSIVYVMPNQLEVYITISNPQPFSNPGDAYDYVSNAVNGFIASIGSLGINYTTLGFTLNPIYNQNILVGYRASYELRITMELPINESLLSRILNHATQHSATNVYLAFTLSPSEARRAEVRALSEALIDAMVKVNSTANTIGKSLITIKSVRESIFIPQPLVYRVESPEVSGIPVSPGPISVSATVIVDAVVG